MSYAWHNVSSTGVRPFMRKRFCVMDPLPHALLLVELVAIGRVGRILDLAVGLFIPASRGPRPAPGTQRLPRREELDVPPAHERPDLVQLEVLLALVGAHRLVLGVGALFLFLLLLFAFSLLLLLALLLLLLLALLLVGLFGGLLLVRELVGAPARSGSAYIDMQGLYGDRRGAWAGGVPLGRWLAWPPASATCRLRALVAEVESTRLALPRLLAVDDGMTTIAAVASDHVVRLDAKGHHQHAVAVRALHCVWAPLGRLGRRPRSVSEIRLGPRIAAKCHRVGVEPD